MSTFQFDIALRKIAHYTVEDFTDLIIPLVMFSKRFWIAPC